MIEILERDHAVHTIAAHLADRDSYVITVPPYAITPMATRLCATANHTAYLDTGLPFILATDEGATLAAVGTLVPMAIVLTVPKTVPPSVLARAIGQPVPDDGSQDIVIIQRRDGRATHWPVLFVDALEAVDPRAAAEIRANQVQNLN